MKNSIKNTPILSLRNVSISFAKKVLFEDISFNIFPQDRICLIGKNGTGKTSLMNAIFGIIEFDCGDRWVYPKANIGYLQQSESLPQDISVLEYIMAKLQLDEHKSYLIDIICDNLQINKNAIIGTLSGGMQRRVDLAKTLIFEPDILMLDEPTNHLDLAIIQWLEEYLQSYNGAILIISHDRKFLEKVSNKVFWLRSKSIKINNLGYKNFDEWSINIIEHEKRELQNLEKKFELESAWLQTGVTARRKRNIGRLHYLKELRSKLQAQKNLVNSNKNRISIEYGSEEEDAPQVIASFNNVSKAYDEKILVNKFSIKILRGEKIGLIGKNGSGKSTFLKMLIGEVKPDSGTIKLARDLKFSYFDQQRKSIKLNATIKDTLCDSGSDYVTLSNGKTRHICSYLKDFLFDPEDTETLVGTLSGGQQNRLLLAKTLANCGNFLILDEPTNDLDMDSLDFLQNYLIDYTGTLLVVSHDRDFLDNVATTILGFEDNGEIINNLGGYSDYIEYKEKNFKDAPIIIPANKKENKEINISLNSTQIIKPQSSSRNKAEFEKITKKIEKIEEKIKELSEELSGTEDRNSANLAHITMEIVKNQNELENLQLRWEELYNLINK